MPTRRVETAEPQGPQQSLDQSDRDATSPCQERRYVVPVLSSLAARGLGDWRTRFELPTSALLCSGESYGTPRVTVAIRTTLLDVR